MSVEEGLKSADAGVIKSARGVAKGKVTKYITALKNCLVVGADGKYLLDEIDVERVDNVYTCLNNSYDEFQELHERYLQYGACDDSIQYVVDVETKYADDVGSKVSEICRSYLRFKKAIKETNSKAKVKALEIKIQSLKTALEGTFEAAKTVATSEDEATKKTARAVKTNLRSSLDLYSSKIDELEELKGQNQDLEEKVSTIVTER